jgi:periplasmic protein CpxP/Spy
MSFIPLSKLAITVAISGLVLLGAGTAGAQTAPTETRQPERAKEREGMRAERLFDRIKATPEQRQKIKDIMKTARSDMNKERAGVQESRRALVEALAAPTLDKALIEKLRADQSAKQEANSKRLTQAMIETAEVLNPEQRQQVKGRFGMALMDQGPMTAHRFHGPGGMHHDRQRSQAAPKTQAQ